MTSEDARPDPDPRATIEQATGRRMLPAAAAAVTLSTSPTDVWSLVQTGRLNAAVVAGELFVYPAQVEAIALARMRDEQDNAIALQGPYTDALRTYLAETPATGDVRVALDEGRPLVTTCRGPRRRHGGLAHHGILVHARALAAFIADRTVLDTPGDPGASHDGARYGPWRALPSAGNLHAGLLLLPGIADQQNGTGVATPDERSRRLYGWVRVDPDRYPPNLDDALRDLVTDDMGARRRTAERERADVAGSAEPVTAVGPADPWAES